MDFWTSAEATENIWGLPEEASDAAASEFRLEEPVFRSLDFMGPSLATNPHLAPHAPSMSMGPGMVADANATMGGSDTYVPPKLPVHISLFPLERTHFFTNANPKDVAEVFNNAFKKNNVEASFDAVKYKFKCNFNVVDENGKTRETLNFRARIWTVDQHKKYVVELQRRQGCCLEWGKLFNDLKNSIPMERIVQ